MAILRISLDSCTTERVEDVTGSGLDLAFSLFDEFRDSDPVIFTSPSEEAIRFPGCAFFTMLFMSPITESIAMESSPMAAGYSMRRLGYDAVVITGRARKLSYISISTEGAEFFSAEPMKGMASEVFEDAVRKNVTDVGLSIGRAGENGVLFASLQAAGREAAVQGLGCLFGRKNLKGIIFPGFPRKDSLGSGKAERRVRRRLEKSRICRRIRREGGGVFIDSALRMGWLPVDGYSRRYDPRAYFLDGKAMIDGYGVHPEACQECFFSCGRRTKDNELLPTWQEMAALGSNLGFYMISDVMRIAAAVREEGLGIYDTGALLAYLRALPPDDISGLPLLRGKGLDEYVRVVHLVSEKGQFTSRLAEGIRAFPDAVAMGNGLPLMTDLRGDAAGAVLAAFGLGYELNAAWLLPPKPLSLQSGAIMALYESAYRLSLVSQGYSPMGTIGEWWGRFPRSIFRVPFILRIVAILMKAYGIRGRDILSKGIGYMERLSAGQYRLPERFTMESQSDYGDNATIQYTRLLECFQREKEIALRIPKSRSEKRKRPSSDRSAAVGPAEDLDREGDPGLQK